MPREITKTVFSFQELVDLEKKKEVSSKAVDRARDWLLEGALDHDWWDYVYEMWTSALNQIGFENVKISFSGFCSQGDGASFTASVDVRKLSKFVGTLRTPSDVIGVDKGGKEDFAAWIVHKCNSLAFDPRYLLFGTQRHACMLSATVTRGDSRYSHESTCRFEADYARTSESQNKIMFALSQEWEKSCEELRYDLCKAIYKSLEEEHDYLTSDESLAENAEANEYCFTIDGEHT